MRKANRAVKMPRSVKVLPDAAPVEEALALASVGVPGTADGPEVVVWKPLEVGDTTDGPALLEAEEVGTEPLALEEGVPGREPLAEALPPPPIVGGADAWDGLTSMPVPHGMLALVPGCVWCSGGTDSPLGPAKTKRPVQYRLDELGDENW